MRPCRLGRRCSTRHPRTSTTRWPQSWTYVCAARSNLAPTFGPTYVKGPAPTIAHHINPMARQITCECGEVVRGETEHELVERTLEHLRHDHPQLVDKVTRQDIVAMIEVVD